MENYKEIGQMKKLVLISSLLFGLSAFVYGQKSYMLDTPDTESKEYIARDFVKFEPGYAFTAGVDRTMVAKIDNTMLSVPTEDAYLKPDGTTTSDPTQGVAFGKIGGTLNVNPIGSLLYQIPIEIPSGINNMQPNIQISYNSQAGNGIVGYGFNISGISSINRTRKNLFNDGKNDAIHLSETDNLEIDGIRLALISGSNLVSGAKYRTQEESYSDITFYNADGSSYFEVVTKEGVKMTYGASVDSRIEAQGTDIPFNWLLTKMMDANGNYVAYEYGEDSDNGEFWLSKIHYTGNLNANVNPANEIEFIYESNRQDSKVSYAVGSKFSMTKLLKSIKVKTNEQILKEYSLSYAFDGFYNKLASVGMSNGKNEKVSPIILNWNILNQDEPLAHKIENKSIIPFAQGDNYSEYTVLVDDFNNDGISDFVKTNTDEISGFSSIGGIITSWTLYLSRKEDTHVSYEKTMEIPMNFMGILTFYSMDVNNDGTKDLIEVRNNCSNYDCYDYEVDVHLNDGNGILEKQDFKNISDLFPEGNLRFRQLDFYDSGIQIDNAT